MCIGRNIENLDQIVCAIKKENSEVNITTKEVRFSKDELDALIPSGNAEYYGIINSGVDTSVRIEGFDGSLFDITANSQIIINFRAIIITGNNCWFRGYSITLGA